MIDLFLEFMELELFRKQIFFGYASFEDFVFQFFVIQAAAKFVEQKVTGYCKNICIKSFGSFNIPPVFPKINTS